MPEDLEDVPELSVDVTAHRDRALDEVHVALLEQQVADPLA